MSESKVKTFDKRIFMDKSMAKMRLVHSGGPELLHFCTFVLSICLRVGAYVRWTAVRMLDGWRMEDGQDGGCVVCAPPVNPG